MNWSDEIAQQTHDLEDGIELAGTTRSKPLRWPASPGPAGRRAQPRRAPRFAHPRHDRHAHHGPDPASRTRIDSWIESKSISTPAEFEEWRKRLPGDLVGFSEEGRKLYGELRQFVYRHVIHSFPVSRHDGRARRVVSGLFHAYSENPRLLPDSVLEAVAGELGVRFLREVPLSEVRSEVARSYRTRPEFYRSIADHIAGMTDSYCIAEYREVVTG